MTHFNEMMTHIYNTTDMYVEGIDYNTIYNDVTHNIINNIIPMDMYGFTYEHICALYEFLTPLVHTTINNIPIHNIMSVVQVLYIIDFVPNIDHIL